MDLLERYGAITGHEYGDSALAEDVIGCFPPWRGYLKENVFFLEDLLGLLVNESIDFEDGKIGLVVGEAVVVVDLGDPDALPVDLLPNLRGKIENGGRH